MSTTWWCQRAHKDNTFTMPWPYRMKSAEWSIDSFIWFYGPKNYGEQSAREHIKLNNNLMQKANSFEQRHSLLNIHHFICRRHTSSKWYNAVDWDWKVNSWISAAPQSSNGDDYTVVLMTFLFIDFEYVFHTIFSFAEVILHNRTQYRLVCYESNGKWKGWKHKVGLNWHTPHTICIMSILFSMQ